MNKRHTLFAVVVLACAGLWTAWWWVPEVTKGPPKGILMGAEQEMMTAVEGARVLARSEVAVAARVEAPALEADVSAAVPEVASEWVIEFYLDHSLVDQRGYPRRGSGTLVHYFGAVFVPGLPAIELGRMSLPVEGLTRIMVRDAAFESSLAGATLTLSSTPDGIDALGRIYFDEGLHSRVSRSFSREDLSTSEPRKIDLVRLLVQPVPRLGLLRIAPREDAEELDVYVSPYGAQQELLGQFGRPAPGGVRQMTSNGGELEAFSFAVGADWSVLVKAKGGALLASAEAKRGVDIAIEYDRPQGMKVTVDLTRTPDARRILIVTRDTATAGVLGEAAYEARLRAAVRTAAIPLPRFRGPQESLTTGLLDLVDGDFRIELWGRKGDSEWQRFLVRDASVAGDIVEVFL